MNATSGIRLQRPAYLGGFIKYDILEPLGLSVTAAAVALGVTRAALSDLLNERAHLSSEMALRLGKAFGAPMDTLMRMQNSHDIARTRKRESEIDVARSYWKPRRCANRSGLTVHHTFGVQYCVPETTELRKSVRT